MAAGRRNSAISWPQRPPGTKIFHNGSVWPAFLVCLPFFAIFPKHHFWGKNFPPRKNWVNYPSEGNFPFKIAFPFPRNNLSSHEMKGLRKRSFDGFCLEENLRLSPAREIYLKPFFASQDVMVVNHNLEVFLAGALCREFWKFMRISDGMPWENPTEFAEKAETPELWWIYPRNAIKICMSFRNSLNNAPAKISLHRLGAGHLFTHTNLTPKIRSQINYAGSCASCYVGTPKVGRAPICSFLRKCSVFCGNLRGFLRPPKAWIFWRRGESEKISGFLWKSAFWTLSLSVTLAPSPQARPDLPKNALFLKEKRSDLARRVHPKGCLTK